LLRSVCRHRVGHCEGHMRKWTQPALLSAGVHVHIADRAVADCMTAMPAPFRIQWTVQDAAHHVRAKRMAPLQTAKSA
jgi:hypothetical protein